MGAIKGKHNSRARRVTSGFDDEYGVWNVILQLTFNLLCFSLRPSLIIITTFSGLKIKYFYNTLLYMYVMNPL